MNILVLFPDFGSIGCNLFYHLINTRHFFWEIETRARIIASCFGLKTVGVFTILGFVCCFF